MSISYESQPTVLKIIRNLFLAAARVSSAYQSDRTPRPATNQALLSQRGGTLSAIIFLSWLSHMTDSSSALSSAFQNVSSVAASPLDTTEGMASNSIKLLTGNSHPELAQAVAKRFVYS